MDRSMERGKWRAGQRLIVLTTLRFCVATCSAQVVITSPSDLAQMSTGFDTFTDQVRGDCVADNGNSPPVAGQGVLITITQISNEREFSSQVSISAKAKYALFSTGGQYVGSEEFNRYSTYLAVVAKIDVRTRRSQSPAIKDAALHLAQTDIASFRRKCGNGYVRSLTKGGEYSALVEVFSSTEAERQDTNLQAAGAGGVFTAAAKASSQLSKFLANKRYTVKLIRKGGGGPIAASPETILADALSYPENLKGADDSALSTTHVEILDYPTLLEFPVGVAAAPLGDTTKLLELERYDSIAADRRQLAADIQYVLDNAEQFDVTNENLKELRARLTAVRTSLFEMKKGINKCFDELGSSCNLTDPPASDPITLPARRTGQTRQQLEQRITRSTAALAPLYDPNYPMHKGGDPQIIISCGMVKETFGLTCFEAVVKYCQAAQCKP